MVEQGLQSRSLADRIGVSRTQRHTTLPRVRCIDTTWTYNSAQILRDSPVAFGIHKDEHLKASDFLDALEVAWNALEEETACHHNRSQTDPT